MRVRSPRFLLAGFLLVSGGLPYLPGNGFVISVAVLMFLKGGWFVLTELLASEDLYRDHQLFRSTLEEHDHLEKELNRLMEQWETMNAELEYLESCNL